MSTMYLKDWLGEDLLDWAHLDARVRKVESTLPTARVNILRPFTYFHPSQARVVILGQDPYPAPGKANGLAFGISEDWVGPRLHSSFGNIVAEVREECGGVPVLLNRWATLESWAEQGVLLLNTRLTVEAGKPGSHMGYGWEALVRRALHRLLLLQPDVVLVAWGAESRRMLVALLGELPRPRTTPGPVLLTWSHPCKFAARRATSTVPAFLGGKVFGQINAELDSRGLPSVEWLRLPRS